MEKIEWPTHPVIMVSVAFCFNEKKELLLVKQKDRNYWSPPSGEVEKNETPVQAAIRETKEEIDLHIKVVRTLEPVVKWENEYQNAVIILFHFICEIVKGEVKYMKTSEPQYDVIDHKWMSLENISEGKIKVASNILFLIDKLQDNLKDFKDGKFIR